MYNEAILRVVGKYWLLITSLVSWVSYYLQSIVVEAQCHQLLLSSKAVQTMDLIAVQHWNKRHVREEEEQSPGALSSILTKYISR